MPPAKKAKQDSVNWKSQERVVGRFVKVNAPEKKRKKIVKAAEAEKAKEEVCMQIQELMLAQKERIVQNNSKHKEQQKLAKLGNELVLAEKAFEHEEKVKQLNDKNEILEKINEKLRYENSNNEEKRKEGKIQALKNTQQTKAARTAQRAAVAERTHAMNKVTAKTEELQALQTELNNVRDDLKKQTRITAVVYTLF